MCPTGARPTVVAFSPPPSTTSLQLFAILPSDQYIHVQRSLPTLFKHSMLLHTAAATLHVQRGIKEGGGGARSLGWVGGEEISRRRQRRGLRSPPSGILNLYRPRYLNLLSVCVVRFDLSKIYVPLGAPAFLPAESRLTGSFFHCSWIIHCKLQVSGSGSVCVCVWRLMLCLLQKSTIDTTSFMKCYASPSLYIRSICYASFTTQIDRSYPIKLSDRTLMLFLSSNDTLTLDGWV